jgi:energy-coupling factor transport system ATP-binding protein
LVLKGIDLEVEGNVCTAIIGPNGGGKTTLGKIMTGILKPTDGVVRINSRDTRELELSEVGATIGYLFQEPERQLFAPTVWEEVSFVMEIKGVPKETIDIEVGRILKQFHLSELGEASPFLLSRGEKQRLALAAIMVNNPSFFILDEPTTGLDMERKDVLSGILNSLLERGTGMIIISHDHKFVAKHADRVIEISGGEVVYDGHYLPGSQD